jgi:hypothetical protein
MQVTSWQSGTVNTQNKIWESNGSNYEEYSLLGCDAI